MHVFRRKCSRQMNAVCQNKTGAIWQLDVTRLYAILIGSNRPSFVRERCIPFSLAFVTKNNASKEIRGKHRKNNLETWFHKTILHFNWPQRPRLCSWRVHPFFTSVCDQETRIWRNQTKKCDKMIWQLGVTRLYAILIGPKRHNFVLERCISFSLAFVIKNNAS